MANRIPFHSVFIHAEIQQQAQEQFELEGCPPDRELDHWLRAEAEFMERMRLNQSSSMQPPSRDIP